MNCSSKDCTGVGLLYQMMWKLLLKKEHLSCTLAQFGLPKYVVCQVVGGFNESAPALMIH